jgi:hypothetical protein
MFMQVLVFGSKSPSLAACAKYANNTVVTDANIQHSEHQIPPLYTIQSHFDPP